MKCKLLHAVHLPALDRIVARDGALLIEVLVWDSGGKVPYCIYQRGQAGIDQKLIEPCLRDGRGGAVVGEYSDMGLGMDRMSPYSVIGVLRGYSRSESVVTPGGKWKLVLDVEVPEHLAAVFAHCNRAELRGWDDD